MKTDTNKKGKKQILPFVIGIAFFCFGFIVLCLPEKKENTHVSIADSNEIASICELATLRSYYHNVAMYEEEPGGGDKFVNDVLLFPFGGFSRIGYKQFWMEYSGIVDIGIDAGQIRISEPDAQNVVNIYVPDAKVLNVYADEHTLTEPIDETGWFTTVSGEERSRAFSEAQTAMREEAENDQALLTRAKNNAKTLLENYIVNTGEAMDTKYTVNWTKEPD